MANRNINFDVNATEQPTEHVLAILSDIYKNGYSNPSATYLDAQRSLEMVERARQQIAVALGCDSDEIFFTSGASESNSWITYYFNYQLKRDPRSHHSVEKFEDNYINTKLDNVIAFPLVVSETGDYLLYDYMDNNDLWAVDLTQAIGRKKICLHSKPNIILASASGHKFGGILGCGILYIKKEIQNQLIERYGNIPPIIYGSQEKGFRGGTLNVPAIVCFGEAIEEATKNMKRNNDKITKILDYIEENAKQFIKIRRGDTNVINITFNNLLAFTAVQLFDKNGINISAGSACEAGNEKPSEVYLATGFTENESNKTIRISVSQNNTLKEAKQFIKVLKKIIDEYDS